MKKDLEYVYELVTNTLPIAKMGELFALDSGYYVNKDESIFLRSTNFTGRIIKKVKNDRTRNSN